MNTIRDWAVRWGVTAAALNDLRTGLGAGDAQPNAPWASEAAVMAQVRLEASAKGLRLWRNNVGGMYDNTGRFVRFGLANESKKMNEVVKSGDLIGIRPVHIYPEHVGTTIGQFVSRECKYAGWRYTGSDREQAQVAWAALITTLGGDAHFADGEGTL